MRINRRSLFALTTLTGLPGIAVTTPAKAQPTGEATDPHGNRCEIHARPTTMHASISDAYGRRVFYWRAGAKAPLNARVEFEHEAGWFAVKWTESDQRKHVLFIGDDGDGWDVRNTPSLLWTMDEL